MAGHGYRECNGSFVLLIEKRSHPLVLIKSMAGTVGSETVGHTDPFVPERPRCGHAVVVGVYVDDTFFYGQNIIYNRGEDPHIPDTCDCIGNQDLIA